jgi:hypothetical protein
MELNLSNKVVVASGKLHKGESSTDAEKAIAKECVIAVIKEVGGVPTTADGKDALGLFVNKIRATVIEKGEIPEKYKADNKTRSWSSYAHLAKCALAGLRTAAKAKTKSA